MLSHKLTVGDTLYVILDGDKCRKANHLLFSTQVQLQLINGQTLCLDGRYCFDCEQVQITRNLWAENNGYHPLVLADTILKGFEDVNWGLERIDVSYNGDYPERRDISKLKEYGYSVSQDSALTDDARQELLHFLITTKKVSKSYVICYLKHMIQINGRKETNYIAMKKWRNDLEYVMKLECL